MKITVALSNDPAVDDVLILALNLSEDLELENLIAVCAAKTGFPAKDIELLHQGIPLVGDKKSLKQFGIREDDLIVLQHVDQAISAGERSFMMTERQAEQFGLYGMTPGADPLAEETQKMIADEIHKRNVEANMLAALEHSPEIFGQVFMLYIKCHINGHPVTAFIDSGAQMTMMSEVCANRCNLEYLVDSRWQGMALGVGQQKIVGRIHTAQLQIESTFLTSSFSILKQQTMDVILGLDMLKRHECVIDLRRGVLQIGTTRTETPFLSEGELPAFARLANVMSEESTAGEHQS